MRALGYVLMVSTALTWATNGVASRLAFDSGLAPTDLAAIRIWGSALLFGFGAIAVLRHLTRRELAIIGLFGTVGIMLAQYLYYEAIQRIDVAVALVIIYMNPIVVAAYQRFRHGERLPRRALWSMALAIGGVVVMVVGRDGGLGRISTVGMLLAVGTMLGASAQMILAERLPRSMTPVQRTGAGMAAAGLVWLLANPAWTVPWGSLGDAAQLGRLTHATVPMLVLVLWVTIVGTAVPYLTLVAGSVRIGAGAASVVTMLEPVVASVLAWIALGQSLAPLQILGVATALVGVLLVELSRTAHTPVISPGD